MEKLDAPKFTSDWFSVWIPTWQKYVVPLLASVDGARWLEIGSYEGRSALWTLDNVLSGKRSSLTCVDAWGSEYEPRFDSNMVGRPNVRKLKGRFSEVLPTLLTGENLGCFHGVYLDGSHEEADTLANANIAWRLLRQGGVLVFDDYGNPEYPGVQRAVDAFLAQSHVCYDPLYKGPPVSVFPEQSSWQVMVVKRTVVSKDCVAIPPPDPSSFRALLTRARSRVSPRTIIDIGASNGSWSLMAESTWPDARYFLIEANPVFDSDLEVLCKRDARFDYVLGLAGAADGKARCQFNEENPFQGIALGSQPNGIFVDAVTVDAQVRVRRLPAPYLLKFDVHGHELAILQGAQTTLLDTCAVVMEVYGWRQCVGSLRFWEMCSYLEYLGFRCTDLCEPLYRPYDGRLSQVDMLFERSDAPGMDSPRWT